MEKAHHSKEIKKRQTLSNKIMVLYYIYTRFNLRFFFFFECLSRRVPVPETNNPLNPHENSPGKLMSVQQRYSHVFVSTFPKNRKLTFFIRKIEASTKKNVFEARYLYFLF